MSCLSWVLSPEDIAMLKATDTNTIGIDVDLHGGMYAVTLHRRGAEWVEYRHTGLSWPFPMAAHEISRPGDVWLCAVCDK